MERCTGSSNKTVMVLKMDKLPYINHALFTLVLTCLQYRHFENIVGKEEISCNKFLFSFPILFSTCLENFLQFTVQPVLETTCIKQSTALRDQCSDTTPLLNPFPHNDTFWRPWETSLLKTLWEKEKLLVTSNFSFSHSVFYPLGELCCHFHQIWNCRLQTLSVWESLKSVVW